MMSETNHLDSQLPANVAGRRPMKRFHSRQASLTGGAFFLQKMIHPGVSVKEFPGFGNSNPFLGPAVSF